MVDLWGPGAFGAAQPSASRPAYTPTNGASDPDTFYRDCTSPAADDGTEWRAAALNAMLTQLRAVVRKSGLTASNLDDNLLAAALRSQGLNYVATVGGTVNAITATLDPAPTAYSNGLPIVINFTAANTGAATLNLNSLGAKTIVNLFGGALVGGELMGPVGLIYDGTKFWASVIQPVLSANRTYYVNASTGNDSNNGLTAGTAFATIQKAVNAVSLVNRNGYACDIQIADGSYVGFQTRDLVGPGSTTITGNNTTPGNVTVTGATGNPGINARHSGYYITGMKPAGASGQANFYVLAASVSIGVMEWPTNSTTSHMAVGNGGTLFIDGLQRFVGNANQAHMFAADGGSIRSTTNAALVIPTTLAVGTWAIASNGLINVTYPAGYTGGGNIASGAKFNVGANGVINVQGAGVNYYPGPTAGVTSTGGQYV